MKNKVAGWFVGTLFWFFAAFWLAGAASLIINGWQILVRMFESDPESGSFILLGLLFLMALVLHLRVAQWCILQAIRSERAVSTQSEETP